MLKIKWMEFDEKRSNLLKYMEGGKLYKIKECMYSDPNFVLNLTWFILQATPFFTSTWSCLRSHQIPSEIYLETADSIHFQPLLAQQLLISNNFVLRSFALIGVKHVFSSFLYRSVVFQKAVAEFWRNLSFFYGFCHLVG